MSNQIPSLPAHKDPPVVRTLKPPPEIWELVHPVESKQFNPRVNFIRRLKMSATSLILMAMVAGVFLGVCIAVLRLRGVPKPTTVETLRSVQVGSGPSGKETANPATSSALPSTAPPSTALPSTALPSTAPSSYGTVTQQASATEGDNPTRPSLPSSKRKVRTALAAQQLDIKSETPTSARNNPVPARSAAPATDGATDSNKKGSSDSAAVKPKSNTGLSPQVITPVKSDTERKAKVIQWP